MLSERNKEEMRLWSEHKEVNEIKYPSEPVIRYLHNNFPIGKDNKILDFGCGTGRNTLVMADMQFDIYAADYNEICLERTKEKLEKINYQNVIYIKNDRTSIPIESSILDCIVAWGALFYCNAADRNLLFSELNRILKIGGCFLSDFRTKEDYLYGKGKEIEKDYFILEEYLPGMNYWFCDEKAIRELYREHGFEIVNLEKADFYRDNMEKKVSHYHVWAKKEREQCVKI
ncbi:MAG: class I SAM-dependent methyltransferase [Lachnospiraceae bacterium]|nr:class I SAM-dependent methyltransferase [Lachnospiraceae bacterium]